MQEISPGSSPGNRCHGDTCPVGGARLSSEGEGEDPSCDQEV